jgi:hypothetical protein
MDLDGGVIHNEGRLKGWALKSRLFGALNGNERSAVSKFLSFLELF